MMPGSRRDNWIEFQRATLTRGALGTVAPASWASLGERLAAVRWGTSQERREAGAEGAVQAATFRVLNDSLTDTVTVTDRIVYAGLSFDVTGIAPIGRDEIEFTATASRG